jgi:NAD(P)-dependent dehydrogenase (short-subunit alcohol dehydrogenase family)
MKTVLITGCSSGFGFATANYFLSQGWKVIATIRNLADNPFTASEQLRVLPLDITDLKSIELAVELVGPIDVLVNNAGIGILGALEGTSVEHIHEVFSTNTLGTINMTKACIPQFRQQKSGVIINVTSSVTLSPLPLLAVYTASKAAINAFTESLAIELVPFNIRVNLVLPGRAPATQFGANAQTRMKNAFPEPYSDLAKKVFSSWQEETLVTNTQDVVDAIWQAANDSNSPLRIIAGDDAKALASNA